MRKSFITTLALVTFAISAMAQQWEINFGDTTDVNQYSRIDAGIIDANDDAVLIGRFGRRFDWSTQLVKVHSDGSHERYVCQELPRMLLFKDLVQLHNGDYFAVGARIQDTAMANFGGSELWAVVFNGDFDIVKTKVYTKDTVELMGSPRLLLEEDGTVVACAEWYERLYWCFPYMYRFDENADTLACRYEKPQNYVYNDPIFQMHDFECFKIFKNPLDNGYIFLCNHGGMGTAFYDENFQYKKAYRYGTATYIFALGDRGYSDFLLSDNSLLLFGTRHSGDDGINQYHLCLADLDLGGGKERDNGTVNCFVTCFHHENGRTEEQGKGKSMAVVNDTTMYGCYFTWYNLGGNMRTGLCLFDRDMEILGGRYFDEDAYYKYWPQFVLPCSDGGCILVMDGGEFLSAYAASKVMKLTREEMNPIPVFVKEMCEVRTSGAYPNPSKDVLNINLEGLGNVVGCRISLTDVFGRPCVDKYIRSEGNLLTLGVTGLNAGVYTYRVYCADRELLVGRFVKE